MINKEIESMCKKKLLFIVILFIFSNLKLFADELKNCEWDNREGVPCIIISKTPNTSFFSEGSVSKIIIDREEIEKSGAVDVVDVLLASFSLWLMSL